MFGEVSVINVRNGGLKLKTLRVLFNCIFFFLSNIFFIKKKKIDQLEIRVRFKI